MQNLIFLAEQTSIQINFMPNLLLQKLFTKEPSKYFIIVNVLLNSDFSQIFLHSKFECQITLTIWGRVGGTGALEILALTLQLRVETSLKGNIILNIAKGKTNPRVEFIFPKQPIGLLTSSNTDLDQTSSSKSRPSIYFKISTKHHQLD